ncbi:MAG TPA: endonuclease/exonuclease/phosphatase family protein [Ideonella sp.]|uniref:endonuclease/exonuclease/phosphatase family protein n=1 Tax=Ideonella sp. TaxID=1929293 RepID=UPI002E355A60|nr:endonuclease/exonuclease/phosphatase family protein [Ideonella sp.]HEX5683866.1 endonuclease/exonuclease/phosphatase family protein [Ideonella sp.]
MATNIRLSTFNCENLFSRARVLSLAEPARRTELLDRLASLPHPPRKLQAAALARHVEFGPGGLRHRRASISNERRDAKAQVLRAVDADVQCLVEAESRLAIEALNRLHLKGRFPFSMLVESHDPRGISVGLMSRLPIITLRSHLFDHDAHGNLFERDCLEVELALSNERRLHLMLTHFHGADVDGTGGDALRRRQATAVSQLLAQRFDLDRDLVAVLGDLGDSPLHAPQSLAPLLKMDGLSDVLALQFAIPDDRWTCHLRQNEQRDYIVVSGALKAAFCQAGIERRGLPDLQSNSIANERPFAGVSTAAHCASQHAAVWADFAC